MASKKTAAHDDASVKSFLWPFYRLLHLGLWLIVVGFMSMAALEGMAIWEVGLFNAVGYSADLVKYYLEQSPNSALSLHVGEQLEQWFFSLSWVTPVVQRIASGQALLNSSHSGVDVRQFLLVAMDSVQLLGIRAMLLFLAAPIFMLLMGIAVIDGLVARYVRRQCAGHESATRHTRAMRMLRYGLVPLVAFVWLVAPVKMPFAALFLPLAVGTAVLIWVAAKYFKKYL